MMGKLNTIILNNNTCRLFTIGEMVKIDVLYKECPPSDEPSYEIYRRSEFLNDICDHTIKLAPKVKRFAFPNRESPLLNVNEQYHSLLKNYIDYLNLQNAVTDIQCTYMRLGMDTQGQFRDLYEMCRQIGDRMFYKLSCLQDMLNSITAMKNMSRYTKMEEIHDLKAKVDQLRPLCYYGPREGLDWDLFRLNRGTSSVGISEKTKLMEEMPLTREQEDRYEELTGHKFPKLHEVEAYFNSMEDQMYDFPDINPVVTMNYDDGGQYKGWVRGNKRIGLGLMKYPSGSSYCGCWEDDRKNSMGAMIYEDGRKYKGLWKDNKFHGLGSCWYDDGGVYLGYFDNNKRCGNGKYTYPGGDYYDGDWVNDIKQGHGVHHYASVDHTYVGNWENDERNGVGTFFKERTSTYCGEWKDGQEHGYGQIFEKDRTFCGSFALGKKNGSGFYLILGEGLEDGTKKIEGHWVDDVLEGTTTISLTDGEVLETIFENGVMKKFICRALGPPKSTLLEFLLESNKDMLSEETFSDIDIHCDVGQDRNQLGNDIMDESQ